MEVPRLMHNYVFGIITATAFLLPFITRDFTTLLILAALGCAIDLWRHPPKKHLNWRCISWTWIFILYIIASYFWSVRPDESLAFIMKSLPLIGAGYLLFWWLANVPPSIMALWGKRFVIAALLGIAISLVLGMWDYYIDDADQFVFWLIDIAQQLGIHVNERNGRWLMAKFNTAISHSVIILFMLAAYYFSQQKYVYALLMMIATPFYFLSDSQGAVVALILALITFALASFSLRFAVGAIMAGFIVMTSLIIPVATNSYHKDWQINKQIDSVASFAVRRWVFYLYARESTDDIFLGKGIRTSYYATLSDPDHYWQAAQGSEKRQDYIHYYFKEPNRFDIKPHNFFLMVIYELGFIGALLFLIAAWQGFNQFTTCIPQSTGRYYLASIVAFFTLHQFNFYYFIGWAISLSLLLCAMGFIIHKTIKEQAL